MSYQSIILLIIGILNLGLAVVVYWCNRKNLANFYYSMMVFTGSLWVFGLFGYSLSANYPDTRLLLLQLIYIFTLLTAFYYFIFAYHFPYRTFRMPKSLLTALYAFVFLYSGMLGFKTDYLIDLSILSTNIEILNIQNYFIFCFVFLLFIFSSFIILLKKYKKAEGIFKKQIKYVILATFLTYGLAALNNISLGFFYTPGSINFWESAWVSLYWLGPIFSLINAYILGWILLKSK